ncbi:FAD-binding oxidoreductase [Leisingera sp. HS039]|uniref:NAD(P)/FAD-dependent oxidoreductase n=1 Tax=unclassified Leisingera TaxID=2614906 RepID=UPI001071463C|nr:MULTISPECIES: FAD-dependent oxidoreductase [unclassified Leisingera]MBQ4823830.1 FAD-binding oxidoreductase [Leisingera sp. HS039]QBR35293.1 FAD-binding oxidoreductase [Leisingera sp. NJS201]
MADFDIAIAGAGAVGMSCALWAQMRGHRVLLMDPEPPGSGTSYGNACTLATYACLPVNDPSVLTSLPGLMFSKDSPLSLSYAHALRNPRWMLSFLANCRAAPSHRIAGHLADLLSHADAGINPLIEAAGAGDLVVARGQLSVWSTGRAGKAATAGLERRRALGVPWREVGPDEALEMEPGLHLPIKRAVHFHAARHLRDPQEFITRMHRAFTELGGSTLTAAVEAVRPSACGVELQAEGQCLTAGHAVIACGAFSRRIEGTGTQKLPLGTERGYHVMFRDEAHRVTRPVGWGEAGFYAVPHANGLRLTGTVEIAALDAPANKRRLAYIARKGAEMLGALPEPDSEWLGYRPTMPDSLPVIGRSPQSERVLYAFGHQHIGLTLGGITGRLIADLAEGRQPNVDLAPFAADRSYA